MEFFDFGTIFFMIAAVVIFFQLRNVLGRRTGNERPPFDPYTASRTRKDEAAEQDNVVSLPRRKGEPLPEAYADVDAVAAPGTDLNRGLRAIKDADPSFEPRTFAEGAKMAYEMIVMAYADGDRRTLKNLLSRDVYDGFVAAIAEREHQQGGSGLGRDEGHRGACDVADCQRADFRHSRQERRRDRRRSRDRGRGKGRMDVCPGHTLEGSKLEACCNRGRGLTRSRRGDDGRARSLARFSGIL
jgi:hypothetical protein